MIRTLLVGLLVLAGFVAAGWLVTPEVDAAECSSHQLPSGAVEVVSADLESDPPAVARETSDPAETPRGPLVHGTVRDARGQAVAGAQIFLVAEDLSWRIGGRTDSSGGFSFESRSGVQSLTVPGMDGLQTARRELHVADHDQRVHIVMQPREVTRFAGRILNAEGCSLGRETRGTVEFHDGSGEIQRLCADDGGYFDVDRVPLGRVVVRTTDPLRTETTFELRRGEADRMELRLDSGRKSYRGRVQSRDGSPISDASIHLERTFEIAPGVRARSFRTAYSDDRGEFRFAGLGEGSGKLTIMASGFTTRLADASTAIPLQVLRLDRVEGDTR